jgi:hypothetical protein
VRWLIFLLFVACAPVGGGADFDVDRAMVHVKALTDIGPRPGDSDGSRTAAGYIEDELDRLGFTVQRQSVGSVEIPEIRVLGHVHREAERVTTTDPNLLVRFGPPGNALLLMAHYDTVRGSPGASDNAVSVALLLELARHMRDEPPDQPIVLAFTANEEIGLVGAEALAAQIGPETRFAIALDLIGGDGRLTLNGASTLIGLAELHWLANAADRAGVELSAPLAHRVISRWWPQAERSDHGAFTRRGIRAVHFYNRGNDGEWVDLAYHTPRDVPARLSRDSVGDAGGLLRALVASPVPPHHGDGFWLPFVANTVVPRWALLAVELLLVVVVLGVLVLARDGLVTTITRRIQRTAESSARRGAGLVAGVVCYALAIVLACVLERELAGAHPAPWLHDPLPALVSSMLVLGGLFGLATRAVARIRPWAGTQRYIVLAALSCVAIGAALLVIGAAELAWIWLVPAAMIVLAPRLGRFRVLAVAAATLPIACLLHPFQLREAHVNGFLPESLPLSLYVGIVGAPTITTLAWMLRRRAPGGPLGTLVLGVGCGLAVILGLVFAVTPDPPCTPANFGRFHLACERV